MSKHVNGITVHPLEAFSRKGKADGEVLVSVGPAPIIYSKLAVPKSPTDEDKYVVNVELNETQRTQLVEQLAPLAVELAKLKGLQLSTPKAGKKLSPEELDKAELNAAIRILEDKMKRLEEPGAYRLGANHRMAFFNKVFDEDGVDTGEEEISIQRISIQGPDGKPLEKLYLTDGSIGIINFVLRCTMNPATGKPALPFRLEALKVTEPVFYESEKRGRHDSFEHVDSDYEVAPEDE